MIMVVCHRALVLWEDRATILPVPRSRRQLRAARVIVLFRLALTTLPQA